MLGHSWSKKKKKESGQHPTNLTSRLVSVKFVCSRMEKVPSNTVSFGSIKYISWWSYEEELSLPTPRPIIKMSEEWNLLKKRVYHQTPKNK